MLYIKRDLYDLKLIALFHKVTECMISDRKNSYR